ncbi:MAG: hypothetical protein LUQ40_05400, partial [Methanomicrobiales archaeon]|nr:hypothetical protein [Methanomicrobiales archaeon]
MNILLFNVTGTGLFIDCPRPPSSMKRSSIASEFQNIDSSNDSDHLICYLDSIDALPLFRGMKERSYEYLGLHEGFAVLDAGCGPGYDAIRMA